MKTFLLLSALMCVFSSPARAAVSAADSLIGAKQLDPADRLPKSIWSAVPNGVAPSNDVAIPTTVLTALEMTGNSGVAPGIAPGAYGISILNWSAAQDIYCCYNDSLCSVSAGVDHGWPILRQPSGGNFNWQYFPLAPWQRLYCIATGSSVTANVILLR